MTIKEVETPDELARCYDVFCQVFPCLKEKGRDVFVDRILLQKKEGYHILTIEENGVTAACIGYRFMHFLVWGKCCYIDHVITGTAFRRKGYASELLSFVTRYAREENCAQIHLDTGYARHEAHRMYLKHGFLLDAHHLCMDLNTVQ